MSPPDGHLREVDDTEGGGSAALATEKGEALVASPYFVLETSWYLVEIGRARPKRLTDGGLITGLACHLFVDAASRAHLKAHGST